MTHTKGPWVADPIYLGDSAKICAHRLFKPNGGGSFATIENMSVQNVRLPNTEAEANTRLISAAPEMLEALKLACEVLRAKDETGIAIHCETIIAKAEGR